MRVSSSALPLFGAAAAQAYIMGRDCTRNNCLRAFLGEGSDALKYCSTYTSGEFIPSWADNCKGDVAKIQSACACIYTAPVMTTTTSASTQTTTTSAVVVPTATTTSVVTTAPSTTSTPTQTTTSMSTTSAPVPVCHVTAWSQIAAAQSLCSDITLDNIVVPSRSGIVLTKLQTAATVTFMGNTSFVYAARNDYKMVQINGNNIKIRGAPGSFLDGGGAQYWDGLGNNGGQAKPGQFMKVSMSNNSVMEDITVINTPTHAINIAGCYDSVVQRVTVDNSAGDAPNNRSNGKSAAHNTDGFNVGIVGNMLLQDCTVIGQDDCVALSTSNNVTIRRFFCSGSHGLSIAGGGSGPGQNISNVVFADSYVTNSTFGLRIKTDFNATGSVRNVTYSNIYMTNIKGPGIDVQQDYLNGGPNGIATNGVAISNLTYTNVTGWVAPEFPAFYTLCGDGSCTDFKYIDVNITGGIASSCNFPESGCPV